MFPEFFIAKKILWGLKGGEDGELTLTLVRTRHSDLCLGDVGLEKRGKKENQGRVGRGLQQPGAVEVSAQGRGLELGGL